MTQHLFNGESTSDKAQLDANFTELYTKTALQTVTAGVFGVAVTPSAWWAGRSGIQIGSAGSADGSLMASPGTSNYVSMASNVYIDASPTARYVNAGPATFYTQNQGIHTWGYAASGSAGAAAALLTPMTLDATGNLLVGTPTNSVTSGGIALQPFGTSANASNINIGHTSGSATGSVFTQFVYAGTAIGSITQNGTTGVAYNTSSDYRLKDSVTPISGSGAFIDALKPCTWTWKSDGTHGAGFIAHELQAVSPASVTGSKDAVDDHGHPVYQAVEYGSSEVIAMLVAEVKSLRARLAAASIA